MKLVLAAVAALIIPFTIASADRQGPPRQPPQEAVAACSNAKSGDACSFTRGERTVSGTCETPPDSSVLACRPERRPPPR